MIIEQNKNLQVLGEKIGYILSYIIFTTLLFFILSWLNKLPIFWNYFHVMILTFLIVMSGKE